MRIFFLTVITAAIILSQLVACTSTSQPRNAELIVTYNGKEVHRAGTAFKSLKEFDTIIRDNTKTKYIIFSAKWCNSCKFLNKALKQSGHWEQVTLINIDEPWVASLASSLGVRAVPSMVVVGKDDSIQKSFVGPSAIVMHLLINVDK
jgi:thiol:disulfide interchange protein